MDYAMQNMVYNHSSDNKKPQVITRLITDICFLRQVKDFMV